MLTALSLPGSAALPCLALLPQLPAWLDTTLYVLLVVIGFSLIIFVHELGHFLAAKWAGVRVDRFAVGFGTRLFGYRRGEGLTFGNRPEYTAAELAERRYGETDYCFKALPIGGYVKMMGQDDIIIDEKTNEVRFSDDPRSFANRPVGKRMVVVSAGVVFNLLLAAVLLVVVFMIGLRMPAPIIGEVSPDSPAFGLLKTGDEVLAIDGAEVDSFGDLINYSVMSSGPLHMRIKRDGQVLDEDVVVEPRFDPRLRVRLLDVGRPKTTRRTAPAIPFGDRPAVQKDDVIIAVDGQPVTNYTEILEHFLLSKGRPLTVTVDRPDPAGGGRTIKVDCVHRGRLAIGPTNVGAPAGLENVLGLQPRRVVLRVEAQDPGARAENLDGGKPGFLIGDVVVQCGATPNPTYREILDEIARSEGRALDFTVERDGRRERLRVLPRWESTGARWLVGVAFPGEEDAVVVADVLPGSPAAALQMPRGARIVALDGKKVASWFDFCETAFALAGRDVTVRYRTGSDEVDGVLHVPGSIVNELGLAPGGLVFAIDGESKVSIKDAAGKARELFLPDPYALKAMLTERVGKTVSIEYSPTYRDAKRSESFTVSAENADPWQMRIRYAVFDEDGFEDATVIVSAEGNPLVALQMGGRWVRNMVLQIYQFISQIAQRRVGTQHVAGPVGIVSVAVERARAGPVDLMLFLAFLSVNLAVINFLPLPVMDGGLMVFLLIEKIKGKPLGIKTQMVTTVIGLAAILLIFIAVTVQDISRLWNG